MPARTGLGEKAGQMGTLKPKLYILHGWTYSLDKWQPLLKLLRERGVEPVMLRLPGLTAKSDQIWTLESYVSWLYRQLPRSGVTLVGHSNGGRVAIAYAATYPESLDKLILIASAGIYHDDLRTRTKRRAGKVLAQTGKKLTHSPKLRKVLYKLLRADDYYRASPNMRLSMQNLLASDKTSKLGKVTTPTTLIWGTQDRLTPLSDGQQMRRLLKQSRLDVIEGAAHSPHFSHTPAVARIILNTMGKQV